MIIESAAAVGPFFENGFVLACERSREGVIIDPGDSVDELLSAVARHQLKVVSILLTHAHIDHITGVPEAKRRHDAPIHLHRDDLFLYDALPQQAAEFDIPLECGPLPPVDRFYSAGEVIRFGDYDVRSHHTPGHCPGGVCLAVTSTASADTHLFVGDTLFAGSIGRTDLWEGDHATLLASIRTVLLPFGDAARVYAGHGPVTTIGRERLTNPFLTCD